MAATIEGARRAAFADKDCNHWGALWIFQLRGGQGFSYTCSTPTSKRRDLDIRDGSTPIERWIYRYRRWEPVDF